MTKQITRLSLLFGLSIVTFISGAQDIQHLTESFLMDVRLGKTTPMPPEILVPENANSIIEVLQPYLKDSTTNVRARTYEIIHRVASGANSAIRIKAVLALTESLKDQDLRNVRAGLKYLKTFAKADFSKSAKDSLVNRFKSKTTDFDQLIKLAGFLDLKELSDEIKPYVQAGNPRQIRWAAILALARMGDEAAIRDLMQRVSKLPVNDDMVYKLFPDLIYTRQRVPIDYMINALNSDQRNCLSADAEKESQILCGYRIMEQLAPVIKDYPFKLDESGDIDTEDYMTALLTVRDWLSTHKNYMILNDRF